MPTPLEIKTDKEMSFVILGFKEIAICPCNKHACKNIDDYVAQGAYCENCFMDCVKVDNA